MLSQQESWVFPIFHSSQEDVSPQGRRNRSTTPSSCFAQFPAQCQGISWPYQHTSGKTSTAHPSLCPGSTEIPKALSSSPTQLRAGIFLHFNSFSKISHRKLQATAQWEISNSGRKSQNFHFRATRPRWRNQNNPRSHWNHHQLRTGSKGKCWEELFPPPAPPRLSSNWSSLLKNCKLLPEQHQGGLTPSRSWELCSGERMGFNGTRQTRNSKSYRFRSTLRLELRPKRSLQF